MNKKNIFLCVLALIFIIIVAIITINFDNIMAIYDATRYTPEEIEKRIEENDKKAQEVLDKYNQHNIEPLSDEDAKKLVKGELSEEEAIKIIMGKKDSETNALDEKTEPSKEIGTEKDKGTEEIKEEEASKLEEKPEVEETDKSEEKPKAEETNKPEEKPKADESSKPEEKPKAEETNKPEEKPKADESSKPEEKPKADESSKPEEKPKEEENNKPEGEVPPTETTPENEEVDIDEQIGELIAKIYVLKAKYNNLIHAENVKVAKNFYSLPKEQQTREKKYQMGLTFMNSLKNLQGQCDIEINSVLAELTGLLKDNNMSTDIVNEIKNSYEEEKKNKKAYFVSKYTAKESRVTNEVK